VALFLETILLMVWFVVGPHEMHMILLSFHKLNPSLVKLLMHCSELLECFFVPSLEVINLGLPRLR